MSDPNVKIHVLTGLGNVGANGSDEVIMPTQPISNLQDKQICFHHS